MPLQIMAKFLLNGFIECIMTVIEYFKSKSFLVTLYQIHIYFPKVSSNDAKKISDLLTLLRK